MNRPAPLLDDDLDFLAPPPPRSDRHLYTADRVFEREMLPPSRRDFGRLLGAVERTGRAPDRRP